MRFPARRPGRLLPLLFSALIVSAAWHGAAAKSPGPAPAPLTELRYEGTLYLEAHFRRPGDVHPYHSVQDYRSDGAGRVRMDWTTWEEGDSSRVPECYLIAGDSVFHRDAPDQPWVEYTGPRAVQGRLIARAGLPEALSQGVNAGREGFATLRVSGGRVEGYTRLWAHPRLGDVRDSVEFRYTGSSDAPDSISMAVYMRDSNWRLVARRVLESREPVADSVLAAPKELKPAPPSEEDEKLGGPPDLAPVAPGVWSLEMADIDSRTLVVEFADHLAVIEAAISSANGERMLEALRRRWPGKPVRQVLFSHYHPSYTGGLRPFIAAGATVVTTAGNADFVRRVAGLTFGLEPDSLAAHPRPPNIETFAERYELADSTNRLVALNYGARSQHTDEFVVFWLPLQRVLFETELGWVKRGGEVHASRRAKALLAWIAEQKLDVDRIVQSYPMRGNDAVVSRARLDSLVQESH